MLCAEEEGRTTTSNAKLLYRAPLLFSGAERVEERKKWKEMSKPSTSVLSAPSPLLLC